jgi:hypothetical protein
MPWTSIPHAHEYWHLTRRVADPPSSLEDSEAFILRARPNTNQDAACILDVVLANAGDPRCDGLDYAALQRVHHYLSTTD